METVPELKNHWLLIDLLILIDWFELFSIFPLYNSH